MNGFSALQLLAAMSTLTSCAADQAAKSLSDQAVVGPSGYSVNWGLPETGAYWVPEKYNDDLKKASDDCEAKISVFVYHHLPRPPQYGYLGFRFEGAVDPRAKSCLVERVNAVPALTIYPKKK